MSEECTHSCETCSKKGTSCSEKTSFLVPANGQSKIGKVIAVMSGKGGVGKSLVTELLAVSAARKGKRVAILDADVTGPSIPTAFGVSEHAVAEDEKTILPCRSQGGVKIMSLNLLVENPADPVVWRGPVIAGVVKQFWSDVKWGDVDIMFVDMPPGTGDVPLTVFQSLPIAGAVVVTSPQDLVRMIVEKAMRMARMMKVPVLGLVENMSGFKCPTCGTTHPVFGASQVADVAAAYGIEKTVSLPLDPRLAALVDEGLVENADTALVDGLVDALL